MVATNFHHNIANLALLFLKLVISLLYSSWLCRECGFVVLATDDILLRLNLIRYQEKEFHCSKSDEGSANSIDKALSVRQEMFQ